MEQMQKKQFDDEGVLNKQPEQKGDTENNVLIMAEREEQRPRKSSSHRQEGVKRAVEAQRLV